MSQWMILFRKEWLEMARNYKLVWIPLVFIALGIMQPVTSYFLPDILKNAGDLPEGSVIEIPLPTSGEVMVQTLGQISQLGVLVLALAFMGIVSSERKSGVLDLVLVKPVSLPHFVTSKWLSAVIVAVVSFFLGMLAAYYYTTRLIGELSFGDFVRGSVTYSLWLVFLVTVVMFLSSFLMQSGLVAFLTLLFAILLSAATSLAPRWMEWSPARLTTHASAFMVSGEAADKFILTLTITTFMIVILLLSSIQLFKQSRT